MGRFDDMKTMRRQNRIRYWVAGLVFVCFLLGGLIYVNQVRISSTRQSRNYLQDGTLHMQTSLMQQIRGDLQVLRGVAIALQEMDLQDSAHINDVLQQINVSNTFVRMGLANTQGVMDLLLLSGEILPDVDVSAQLFFRQGLAGNEYVSDTILNIHNDEYMNYYAVPVVVNGRVAAVLCAANGRGVMEEILDTPVFLGEGYYAIVNPDGVLVSPVLDPNPMVQTGANVFDIAEFTPKEWGELSHALSVQAQANLTFSVNKVPHLVTLQPMGINNWFVISVVPSSTIDQYYNQSAVGIVILLAAASLVFIALLVLQQRQAANNQKELERLAYTDLLTGVRSYAKFQIDAARIMQENPGKRYAIWSMDIKKFSNINDLFGTPVGDRVIQRMATVLEQHAPANSALCRISADNFAGIRAYQDREEIRQWFFEVVDTLQRRVVIPAEQMHISDVMGIYCVSEFDEKLSVMDMVNRAEVAKKAAKHQPGSAAEFFTAEMRDHLREEIELEAAGRSALERGEIIFFLQPKVSIQNGYHVASAEALVRWMHLQYGCMAPGQFIEVFENNGFIVDVDREIFRQVCEWCAGFRQRCTLPLRIAINVSRQGLLREDFVEHYTAVRRQYGIPDGTLELEFTESVVFDDYDLFQKTVEALQANGFMCAIDDFGSGYSSLNVLKNLSIDVLKLDAAFFRGSRDKTREQIVIGNFITMARQLHIKTVAEGVESPEQIEFLREVGCDIVQGYIFSRPLSQADFEALFCMNDGRIDLRDDR